MTRKCVCNRLDVFRVGITLRGSHAGIAQLVEHDLAKVGVASSSLVSRSSHALKEPSSVRSANGFTGWQDYSRMNTFCYHSSLQCGNSSVGRARPCQGRGREFESRFPLQFVKPRVTGVLFFQASGDLFDCRRSEQWPGGRVVMQRPAKPRTPVRFRPWPPLLLS